MTHNQERKVEVGVLAGVIGRTFIFFLNFFLNLFVIIFLCKTNKDLRISGEISSLV